MLFSVYNYLFALQYNNQKGTQLVSHPPRCYQHYQSIYPHRVFFLNKSSTGCSACSLLLVAESQKIKIRVKGQETLIMGKNSEILFNIYVCGSRCGLLYKKTSKSAETLISFVNMALRFKNYHHMYFKHKTTDQRR